MHHEIDAVVERAHVERRGERGIDQRLDVSGACERPQGLEVDAVQVRVRRALGDNQFRVRAQRSFDARNRRLAAGVLDAEAAEELAHEDARLAIRIARDDQVHSRPQHRQQRGHECAHARRGQQRRYAGSAVAFERGKFFFRDTLRGIAVTAVLLAAFILAAKVAAKFVGRTKRIGGGEHEWVRQTVVRLAARLAAVNALGVDASHHLRWFPSESPRGRSR